MFYGTYCRLNVHVHASNLCVIRAARKTLAKRVRRGLKWRVARHKFYRDILHHHQRARALYDKCKF